MATGPNYSKISVNDSGFFIVDSDSATLANGVSFDAGSVTGLRKVTLPNKSGTLAMTSDVGSATSVKASGITEGEAVVTINTNSGNIGIGTNTTASNNISIGTGAVARTITVGNATGATGLDIDSGTGGITIDTTGAFSIDSSATDAAFNIGHVGAAGQDLTIDCSAGSLNLTGGEAMSNAVRIQADNAAGGIDIDAGTGGITIDTTGAFSIDAAGDASNITLATDGDSENLTIAVTGATKSSLILSSAGTDPDALQITTTAGGIDITNGGAAGEDLDIISTNASLNLTAGEAANDAINIRTTNAAGGISISSGTGGTSIYSTGDIILDSSSSGTSAISLVSSGDIYIGLSTDHSLAVDNHTYYFKIDGSTSSAGSAVNIFDGTNAELFSNNGSYFFEANIAARNLANSLAAGYNVRAVANKNGGTLTIKDSSAIAYGDIDYAVTGLGGPDEIKFESSSNFPVIEFVSPQGVPVYYRGLLTVQHHPQ